jgi:xanthine dehydrogenase accessory factor
MESVDLEVFQRAAEWRHAGRSVALVTVVRTWGSSPRPPGSLLAIRDDGRLAGSVSGGCVEEDLVERLRADFPSTPQVVTYGGTREEAGRFGLPCGGTLELVVEPDPEPAPLRALLWALNRRQVTVRRLDLETGRVRLSPAATGEELRFDGRTLATVHGPRWRLFLIGAGQTSRYLARMAQALDYQVIVCDPREEYAGAWDVADAELVTEMPDDAVAACGPDGRTAVVALTHDPKLDDLALLEALKSDAFYVGALGSRDNNQRRRERLTLFDLSPAQIGRLHGPVGLPIGSRTPPEIAVSVLAEMTAVRRGASANPAALPKPRRDAKAEAPDGCRGPESTTPVVPDMESVRACRS